MTNDFAFVAGSAHLDLLARVTGRSNVLDKIGDVGLEIGGSAANIAINLSGLGLPCRFLTSMNRSPFSSVVISFLQQQGVDACVIFDDALPVAAFSAHIDASGELLSAITSTPVDRAVFSEHFLRRSMQGARCAVIDSNLSSDTMDAIAAIAMSMKIPCYCAAVSEPKSLRIADVTNRFSGVFLNRREMLYLREHRMTDDASYEDISQMLGTTIFVTRDEEGVAVVGEQGTTVVQPVSLSNRSGNKLGLGDAFMSAVIYYCVVQGSGPVVAAQRALDYVQSLADKNNCNTGDENAVVSLLGSLDLDAELDELTGVYNRHGSEQIVLRASNLASQNRGSMSLIMVDVDHFKAVNDRHGLAGGDKLLTKVAETLQNVVRGHDSVGRWDGEEFLCVLPDAPLDVARKVAERICVAVRKAISDPTGVTVSCGVSTYHLNESFADTVERACQALYMAKQTGRNKVVVENVLQRAAVNSK
jgi:diguanylate cyclase (GGDEF)-like protein